MKIPMPGLMLEPRRDGMWSVRQWRNYEGIVDLHRQQVETVTKSKDRAFCVGWLHGFKRAERHALERYTLTRLHWLLLVSPSGAVVWKHSLRPIKPINKEENNEEV